MFKSILMIGATILYFIFMFIALVKAFVESASTGIVSLIVVGIAVVFTVVTKE